MRTVENEAEACVLEEEEQSAAIWLCCGVLVYSLSLLRQHGQWGTPDQAVLTWSARSMPIFMVPAEEGQVPQAPCSIATSFQIC